MILKALLHEAIFYATCLAKVEKHSIAVARTEVLHSALGLPATRKPATEEDRGEDNNDPDWLIEQSIARRQVTGGVLHCATAIESYCDRCKK